jgi:hypothetical protein
MGLEGIIRSYIICIRMHRITRLDLSPRSGTRRAKKPVLGQSVTWLHRATKSSASGVPCKLLLNINSTCYERSLTPSTSRDSGNGQREYLDARRGSRVKEVTTRRDSGNGARRISGRKTRVKTEGSNDELQDL